MVVALVCKKQTNMKSKSTLERKEPMKEKSVEETLIFTILEVATQLNKRSASITDRVGITTQQWLIMLFVDGDPNICYMDENPLSEEGILASQIAEALGVSRPNITNLISSLIRKDLVIQIEDTKDKRRKRLKLTEKGEQVLQQIEPYRKQSSGSIFSEFDQETLTQMSENLQKILQHLNFNKKRTVS